MGIFTKIDDILKKDGGIEIRFGPLDDVYGLRKGEIFTGTLIEENIHPKVGDDIELEEKFGYYVIKYNGIEIGKAKPPEKETND